ncbi:EAL domain-containing protein [Bacillus sp. ISL-45]|nr:EAL domain-containing protein [Bacillus sp. ISL-45]
MNLIKYPLLMHLKDILNLIMRNTTLFTNIFPSTLVHPNFPEFIRRLVQDYPIIKGRVVFEINEEPIELGIWDADAFLGRINLLKEMDFQVALDDLKLSLISVKKILKYSPDFVKLDRSCSKNLAHSINKQNAIQSLLSKSQNNVVIVLEGIEKEENLLTASYRNPCSTRILHLETTSFISKKIQNIIKD